MMARSAASTTPSKLRSAVRTVRAVTVYAFGPPPTAWVTETIGRAPLAGEVRVAARGGPPAPGSALEIGGDGLAIVRLPLPPSSPLDATVPLVVVTTPAAPR